MSDECQRYTQKYIISTWSILISSTFTNDNGKTNEFTKYHKYMTLVFIGIQEDIREHIMKVQKAQKYKDETRRAEVERRLQNLFDYCIENTPKLLTKAFNQNTSSRIVTFYIWGAIKAYEGCI